MEKVLSIDFLMINCESPYNVVLGRDLTMLMDVSPPLVISVSNFSTTIWWLS